MEDIFESMESIKANFKERIGKEDFVYLMSEMTGESKRKAEEMFDTITEIIQKALIEKKKVLISGIGIFEVKTRKRKEQRFSYLDFKGSPKLENLLNEKTILS